MKTKITEKIDGYDVIVGTGNAYIDPISTLRYIQQQGIKINEQNKNELLKQYAIYLKNPKEVFISEEEAESIIQKLESLKDNELLSSDKIIIPDYRDKQSYTKKDGKWYVEIVQSIGVIPNKMTLTEEEQIEYNEQIEQDRINNLTDEEREREKEIFIDSLASQALQMEGVLRIKGNKDYEKQAKDWFDKEKKKIEAKYE
jgi:hypothetical protein